MLPLDLLQTLSAHPDAPVLVHLDHTPVPLQSAGFAVHGFVVVAQGQVWRLSPFAAPHLANVWSTLVVIGTSPTVFLHFDRVAGVHPKHFIDLQAFAQITGHLLVQQGQSMPMLPLSTPPVPGGDADENYSAAWQRFAEMRALYQTGWALAPYRFSVDDWLAANQLLQMMAVRGYTLPDVLAKFRSDVTGLLHPEWTVPIVPGRITTRQPPLHALPRQYRDALTARPGSRWVVVTWPDIVTALATLVVEGKLPPTPVPGSDWVLGRHDVSEPELLPTDAEKGLRDLALAWAQRGVSTPLPAPRELGQTTQTVGRLALEAVSWFTTLQLSLLYGAWRRREPVLTGLSDVVPYLGTIAFQIDDRVPLHLVSAYLQHLHAFHVPPIAQVGVQRSTLYPIDAPLTPVALDLDKPTEWPVDCPICGGRADSARDLQQHFREDHPQVAP